MTNYQLVFKRETKKDDLIITKEKNKSKINEDINPFLKEYNKSKKFLNLKEQIANKKHKSIIKINKKMLLDNKLMNYINIIVLLIAINFFRILTHNKFHLIDLKFSKITLKVKGIGNKTVFTNDSNFISNSNLPDKIVINNEEQITIYNSYYFNLTDNIVELIWNNEIRYCSYMFKDCVDITEIDFSNFNTSQVTLMSRMFYNCSSLTSIIFDNFDTSNAKSMTYMFYNCFLLLSLNHQNLILHEF